MTAVQQDRLLRFAGIVKEELERSGEAVAIVARSGLALGRFGIRYSHAGVSLKSSDASPWSVRQLYYACDEERPRLYDQGLPGFVFGTDDADVGYVTIVLPGGVEAARLESAALDNARALRLLGATYNPIAYPFSLRYQNCNQWVAELLAAAWGALDDAIDLRARAQSWLSVNGYDPPAIEVQSPWVMLAANFVPLLRFDDHPEDDLRAWRIRTSLPDALEAFVRGRAPAARRIQVCHNERRVVVRRGWSPIPEGCVAQAGDRVVELD